MSGKHQSSLYKLLFLQEIAFLLLLTVTGLLGGLSAYFWQQNSVESIRINELSYVTERIRGQLLRQIQEAIRARLLEDARALALYEEYSHRIDKDFNKLHSRSASKIEDLAIQKLHVSYRTLQKDMNVIFTNPYSLSMQTRMRLLDSSFADRMIGQFESNYNEFKDLLVNRHQAIDLKLERWSRYAPVVIIISFLLALLLVVYARSTFRKEFLGPIAKVIQSAHLLSTGKLDNRIQEQGVEEVETLARVMNKMAGDLQHSQHALVESEKQAVLGSLVPVVAHNIRNPLASIRATAQMLDEPDSREYLSESKQAIIETIDRLGRWVNALVSYLHPLKPSYSLVYASDLLGTAVNLLKPKIEEKKIRVKQYMQGNDKLLVNADPDLMEQAVCALMANAIDASPRSSTLELYLVRKGTELELQIQDQGPGLPFEPKPTHLTPGPSTKNFGTGLGIPIAFKICQQHGWKLTFDTVSGQGTKAIITAPIRVEI